MASMATAEPLPAPDSSSTRDRLVAAAIEVFLAEGYERARVHDIAREAGLTTGAIYANYRGKAELLFDAIDARTAVEVRALLRDVASERGARSTLETLGDRLLDRRDGQPALLPEAIAAARRDADLASALRERLAQQETEVAALVEQGKREGDIDPALDTAVVARFCLTLALGALSVRTLGMDPPEADQWHALLERLLDACRVPPTPGARPERETSERGSGEPT
jgi:AcrR family transcriptional regulator